MKRLVTMVALLMGVLVMTGGSKIFGQEQTKKETKAQKKQAEKEKINQFVLDQNYEFVPNSASPSGGKTIYLQSTYFIRINKDSATIYLPFYGKAYAGTAYGGDGALEFDGIMNDYKVDSSKSKKGMKTITFVAKKNNENYNVSLRIGETGYSSATIIPQNRSMISFNGVVGELKKK